MQVKKIFSVLVAAGLVASSASFAGSLLVAGKAPQDAVIHVTNVTNTGGRDVYATSQVKIGTWSGTTCYAKSMASPQSLKFPAHTKSAVSLNGDVLKSLFGLGYNCAWIEYTTDKQHNTDGAFSLADDGYTYYKTYPFTDDFSVN
jgi:hypothetical protein